MFSLLGRVIWMLFCQLRARYAMHNFKNAVQNNSPLEHKQNMRYNANVQTERYRRAIEAVKRASERLEK